VYATFRAAIARAEAEAPGAQALIEAASLLAPADQPFDLHAAIAGTDLTGVGGPVSALDQYSLITLDVGARAFGVHRLLQDAARPGPDRPDMAARVRDGLQAALVGAGREGARERVQRLLPHAQALEPHLAGDLATADFCHIAGWAAQELGAIGWTVAEPFYQRAIALREAVSGEEDAGLALSLNNLANLLSGTGRKGEAQPLHRRALAIREKRLGAEHEDVATSLNNLANLLSGTGRKGEAEPLYRRALAIWEKRLGAEHEDVALSLNNLANLLSDTGRKGEAEGLYRRSLAIREKRLGAEHEDVATSLNNLAIILADTGRKGEAEELYRRALAIREKRLGTEHEDVAESLNNLALLLSGTGRTGEAEKLYRRALAIWEKRLGAEHEDVALSLNNLANLLSGTGRKGEAEPLFRRVLAIREKRLGAEHVETARTRFWLAQCLMKTGRMGEGMRMGGEATLVLLRELPPDDPLRKGLQRRMARAAIITALLTLTLLAGLIALGVWVWGVVT
jgi:tetratricopeptide (TPR) repeat protein